jgi:hypothetical protein
MGKKAKFANCAKITVRISYLAVEGKGERVKSNVTLRDADISHQHTHKCSNRLYFNLSLMTMVFEMFFILGLWVGNNWFGLGS